jgi:uncharacterized protein YdhG (YjbR/CyaY superfamily)
MTVDEFVEQKVRPEYRDIVAELRTLMRKHAPKAKEVISYGAPMYVQKGTLAWITPSRTGISLGFRAGAYFEDSYGLLQGQGKHAKNVRMKTLKDMNKTALRYYIKQAVEFDQR